MSEWTELEIASFKGIEFETINVEDTKGQYWPSYQTPGAYAPSHQPTGHTPRMSEFAAIFRGSDYKERLAAFLAACDEPTPGELIHPVFGSLVIVCKGYRVRHTSDYVDAAYVWVTFEEHETQPPIFTPVTYKLPEPKEIAADAATDVIEQRDTQDASFLRKLKSGL